MQPTQKKIFFWLIPEIAIYLVNTLLKTTRFHFFGEFDNYVTTTRKVVALTYDDGPNPPYTNDLLEVLEKNQVKATFFVIGQNVEKYPETIQLILAKGHELGNHSYSHKELVLKTPAFVRSEINKTEQLLRQLGVQQPEIHFRAPFGHKLFILPQVLAEMHKKSIFWDVEPKDYQAQNSEEIVNNVLENVKPGSIIVMHDGGGNRSRTVQATEILIKNLREQGYTFKTVSELID